MTKQLHEPEKPWRELLRESFDVVRAEGGLFALDLEYTPTERENERVITGCCGPTVFLRKPRPAA